ncbi:hypothetical protein BDW22DRAFT_798777 [Trametopsis cervina]|nr:hypothetical protein BDW22DRAFT_798777 [Trametopsis cervina]
MSQRVSKQRFRHPKAKLGPPPALQCIICAKPASPHISAYYGVSACISCYDRLGAARFQPVPEVVEPTVVPRKHPEARTRAKSSIVAPHTSGPPPPPPSHVPFLQPTVPHIVTDRSPSSSKLVVPSSWLNSPLHDLISRLETANHFNQNGEFIFPHFLPASPGATLEVE